LDSGQVEVEIMSLDGSDCLFDRERQNADALITQRYDQTKCHRVTQ